ncbi:MAG: hypothetical protein EZS28_056704, partial [Streblomastix strix]
MASKQAIDRLQKDYGQIKSKPIPGVQVKVDEKDFSKPWQITFDGPVCLCFCFKHKLAQKTAKKI